jgi:hypothetical protein
MKWRGAGGEDLNSPTATVAVITAITAQIAILPLK